MKISNIILSWDFVISIVLTLATANFLPTMIKMSFCVSFYNIGITVLSIIFSLFFSALAIIMTSSDNAFIEFLEENNDFSALLDSFKITLSMLFFSLIYSIVLFVSSDYFAKNNSTNFEQHRGFFLVFESLFTYSLLSSALCVRDTIKFSDLRGKFLKKNNKD